MASNFSLPQFLSMGPRFQVMKPMQITAARTFVSGKNWDPFSDLNTSMKEFDRFSENVVFHLPSFPLQGMCKPGLYMIGYGTVKISRAGKVKVMLHSDGRNLKLV